MTRQQDKFQQARNETRQITSHKSNKFFLNKNDFGQGKKERRKKKKRDPFQRIDYGMGVNSGQSYNEWSL